MTCDLCKARIAPFGFAPPPHLGIKVRRPIRTCEAQVCQDQAQARVALLEAERDPLAGAKDHRAAFSVRRLTEDS